MGVKIKVQNKFYIWLNGEIEKKNQFNLRTPKNSKEWGSKLKQKIKTKLLFKGEIEKTKKIKIMRTKLKK